MNDEGRIEFLYQIYEGHGWDYWEEKSIITLYGHEEIFLYDLDGGHVKSIYTR